MDRNRRHEDGSLRLDVALRKESVDRNIAGRQLPATEPVALRKESVDRNRNSQYSYFLYYVALRKESVDRNIRLVVSYNIKETVALRKESVDRNPENPMISVDEIRRSPQGECG